MKSASNILHLGLDVHKETIAVAIAPEGGGEVRHYGIIGGTLAALDKAIKKLQPPGVELRLVYEAGPCGYVIYRHLKKQGLHCEVVAPSLIPRKASDRVKTDRRDGAQTGARALALAQIQGSLQPRSSSPKRNRR